ncbi:hypothetical protein TSUD_163720 [Trifolium subterraneum]|uniref:Amino acid transporter transmembrane domain-containing protein n=1 Tax=Trifolium subterraneum TaxID=3900 RepID=A0A2Z6P8B2_TRISU|nr:hypothetical protein TSUD_163720 [Trifolium subterraneum]
MPIGKMKLDDDLGPDREDHFQTDDEENQADRYFDNDDDDSDSDKNSPHSNEVDFNTTWPQTYRTSMDMLSSVSLTPTGISFLKRIGSTGKGSFISKENQDDFSNSLTIPLISEEEPSIKQELSTSTSPLQSLRCLESYPGISSYPDIGQAAFGIVGRLGIANCSHIRPQKFRVAVMATDKKIILYMELFASSVEFLILVSDNLSSLFPNTSMTLAVGGIFATILVALCLFWVGAIDHVGYINQEYKFLDIENISVSIGLFGFGFAGHAVFPNIYSSMKDPSKFPLVLYISFAFCLVMYVSVGIVGYIMFGEKIKSQFTLNMPKELYASKIAIWTTVVTPLAKYALTLLPIASSIEELVPSRLRCYAMSIVIRTILFVLAFGETQVFSQLSQNGMNKMVHESLRANQNDS